MATDDLLQQLQKVFWIGGSVCAGKSTTADILGEQCGAAVYHFDQQEPFHVVRSIPEEQPHTIRFMSRTMDERWVLSSPEEMASDAIAFWTERFPMVLEDLAQMLAKGPVIAEGVGLFPLLVAPLLAERRHAAWLISTPEFRGWVRRTRETTVADAPHISDRQRAFRNLLERDTLIASHVRQHAMERGLPVMPVDAKTVTATVERLEPQVTAWIQANS